MKFEKQFIENCFETVQDMVDFIDEFDNDGFMIDSSSSEINQKIRKSVDAELNMFLENIKNLCIEYMSAKKIAMHEWHDGSIMLEENPKIDYSFFK